MYMSACARMCIGVSVCIMYVRVHMCMCVCMCVCARVCARERARVSVCA